MSEEGGFGSCFRQGFKNLGGDDLTDFDARALAGAWKERGAELIFMNAIHGGEVLYPSALTPMAEALHGRDLVGEFTDECRRVGIRSGAYISPLQHQPFVQAHPEWRQTRTDGSFYGDNDKRGLYNYTGMANFSIDHDVLIEARAIGFMAGSPGSIRILPTPSKRRSSPWSPPRVPAPSPGCVR